MEAGCGSPVEPMVSICPILWQRDVKFQQTKPTQLNLPRGSHVNQLCEDPRGSQSPPPHLIMFDWCPLHPLTCSSVGGNQPIPHSAVSYLCAVTCLAADWIGMDDVHGPCCAAGPCAFWLGSFEQNDLLSWRPLCVQDLRTQGSWVDVCPTPIWPLWGLHCGLSRGFISIGYRKWETIKQLTRFQIMEVISS